MSYVASRRSRTTPSPPSLLTHVRSYSRGSLIIKTKIKRLAVVYREGRDRSFETAHIFGACAHRFYVTITVHDSNQNVLRTRKLSFAPNSELQQKLTLPSQACRISGARSAVLVINLKLDLHEFLRS